MRGHIPHEEAVPIPGWSSEWAGCLPQSQGADLGALTYVGSKLELEQSTGRKHSSTSSRAEALTTHLTWQETDTAGGLVGDTEALKWFIAKDFCS